MAGPDAAIVLEFEDQFDHLFQEEMDHLRQYVRVKTGVTGSHAAFGLLGESEMTEITGDRHGDTAWHDSPSYRRWAPKRDFEDAQLVDEEDDLAILVDLEMGYAQNSMYAANRKFNSLIIEAVTATAIGGATPGAANETYDTTAPTVVGGGGNQIASGYGTILDKFRRARTVFNARNVGLMDLRAGRTDAFVWMMGPAQMEEMLEATEATNSMYIGERGERMPLINGIVPFYLGFRIEVSNQLSTVSSERINVAFHKQAMGLGVWRDKRITVDRLPMKHNSKGVIVKLNAGAVRVQNRGVLSIAFTES